MWIMRKIIAALDLYSLLYPMMDKSVSSYDSWINSYKATLLGLFTYYKW